MFADHAKVEVRAGTGGNGALSFRHEKYRAMGGPDGGDGGRGGNLVLKVDHNLNSLAKYRNSRRLEAEDGGAGGGNRRHGKNGEDVIIPVPAGTQVWNGEELMADLTENDQEFIIAQGGRGGFGNAHFKSSTRQAPRTAEIGEPGESHTVHLELKLVAELGFVGLPNAGKSTLLSVISNAKPEIGDYAFTTLIPNLGVVDHREDTYLAADIPGLIEGASEGKGLGDEFLRHIERTAVLLHLVDGLSDQIVADFKTVEGELAAYGHGLIEKPRLVVLTKIEALLPEMIAEKLDELAAATNLQVFAISASAHQGLTELLDATAALVKLDRTARAEAAEAIPVITLDTFAGAANVWHVEGAGANQWRLTGDRMEGFARRTNTEEPDAVARLRDILKRTGVDRELRRQGAEPGDALVIGNTALDWLG